MNRGYAASLEMRKVYERLEDEEGERLGMIRVVNESGQDYLFPRSCFVEITLPGEVAAAFRSPS